MPNTSSPAHPTNPNPERIACATQKSRLSRRERLTLGLFLLLFVVFGVLVEFRSAFLKRRMTDLGVYLRAGWAVRADADIYDITDDNEWHYQYPPLFAILIAPLADPPAGVARTGMVPFAFSAGFWYVFNVFCLFFAVHQLASILEERAGNSRSSPHIFGNRRWWQMRLIPILACIVPTGQTLMRGQVSLLLLALFAAMAAALQRRQSLRAGLWLAGAICLKVIPAFMLLLPFWKKDKRSLVGCAIGLVIGLVLIPAAVFGWPRTVQYYVEYDHKVLRPGIGRDLDKTRARELMETTATDSQSLVAMIHNTVHLKRETRPADASAFVRQLHWIGGAALTMISLIVVGRPTSAMSAPALVLFLGALVFNMLILSPVCHLHYMCLMMPTIMGLVAAAWQRSPYLGWPTKLLLIVNGICGLLPVIPGFEVLRDIGLAMYGTILLWVVGCFELRRQLRRPPLAESVPIEIAAAA